MTIIQKKFREIKAIVHKSVKETPDTWTHYLSVNDDEKNYIAGQFITIDPHQFSELNAITAYLEDQKKKKEKIRAYSITSAPFEKFVAITVKAETFEVDDTMYPPLLSPFLSSPSLVNRPLFFKGYTGSYTLEENHGESTNEVLHIVAGSGIVPSFAILKDEFECNKNTNVIHTMIYVNKKYDDIIFFKEIMNLYHRFTSRFNLLFLLTREDVSPYGSLFKSGRPSYELIQEHIKDVTKVLVFSCGAATTKWQIEKAKRENTVASPRFLDGVKDIISKLGIAKSRFKHEDYG